MAEVYLCRLEFEHGFSKKMAVKIIHPNHSGKEIFRDLFVREARLASSLSHPNVVSVFDFGETDDGYFLVMEYVDGRPLSHVVARIREDSVPVPLPVWRYWMENSLAGLGYLHARGIVHRDVSPGNILVTKDGAVKITDFGISRKIVTAIDGERRIDGKPGYLSPEALIGQGDDSRSDLFSAALCGVELFNGEPVFRSGTYDEARLLLTEFDPQVFTIRSTGGDPGVERLLRKALSLRSEERYQDTDAFIMAIESSIPCRATRREVETFWDSIFPDIQGVETQVDLEKPEGSGRINEQPAILRERSPSYGQGFRRVAVGMAAVVMAGVGTGYYYREIKGNDVAPQIQNIPGVSHLGQVGSNDMVNLGPNRDPVRKVGPVTESTTGTRWKHSALPLQKTPLVEKTEENILSPNERKMAIGIIPIVQAIPWAKVYEGDRYLGETPIRSLEFTVGEHAIRFVNEPLGVDRSFPLTVRENGNQNVIVTLIGSRASD